ncbi:ferritin-like domain-containing protein [Rhodococcoides yunnanense]|uniref:ferritin-like domain-containing protein n=1 Tax=Rhodococcoides yunnanense TaxID=278209 RepID=UPI001C3F9680|nr:ferritin-like protein [Rhodococcus yunnanensis]
MTIETLDDLRTHLQWAIELEHSTIPPYMYALYSLDLSRNSEAAQVISSVFVEEMLHLALAANLLNAVGGKPVLDSPEILPSYPHTLPHSDGSVRIDLAPFGPAALELFLAIEKPASAEAPPEADRYHSIGQFYAAVETGLRMLCETLGEDAVFSGAPERQLHEIHFSSTAGNIVPVHDLASASAALKEIVEQGEGAARTDAWDGNKNVFHPEFDEVAHYYRFVELKCGRRFRTGDTPRSGPTGEEIAVDFDGVRPMRSNPKVADAPEGSAVRTAQDRFNNTYCLLLYLLEDTFNGNPSGMNTAIEAMFTLKGQAQDLMSLPSGDGVTLAGPTFEYVPIDARS